MLVKRIVAFSLLFSLVDLAYSGHYQAPIHASAWKVVANRLECRLSHRIPGYGQATFSQSSHAHQIFALDTILDRLTPAKAIVEVSFPAWKHQVTSPSIAGLSVMAGQKPITMTGDNVYLLLNILEHGNTPVFVVSPANVAHEGFDKIALSSIGFQKGYKEYLGCIDNLLPNAFAQLQDSILYFESGSTILSVESEQRLKELAAFIRADGKIRRIEIQAHADGKGTLQANHYLAARRMWAVKDYLVLSNQIRPDMFTLKDFANKVPVATNKTAAGRAKNRRVVIKLYR